MKLELEENMYVRTKYGISKIISNPNESRFNIDIFKKDGITLRCIRGKDIIKASHNIIDLIEVGDYVNGKEVICNEKYELKLADIEGNWGIRFVEEPEIETIVTKEQFESMAYKVVE